MKHTSAVKITRYVLLLAGILMIAWFAVGQRAVILNFDHPLHVDGAGMTCEDCHLNIAEADAEDMVSYGGHDVCSMCHDVEAEDNCVMCHTSDTPDMVEAKEGMPFTSFAHSTHSELTCQQCHGDAAVMAPTKPGTTDCQACHMKNDVYPHTHEMATWTMDHGMDAFVAGDDCAVCHTQTSCDDCHQGSNVFADNPHPPEWIHTHDVDAMFGERCLTCHETRQYCVDCHSSMLAIPHPLGPDYANPHGGGEHKDDAAAFITSCLTCHDITGDDPTCARCHVE